MEPSSSFTEPQPLPKQFEGSSEMLPLTKHGVSTFRDFRKTEKNLQHLEWLKKIGLCEDEIELYQDKETGRIGRRQIESSVLKARLAAIYEKINNSLPESQSTNQDKQPNVQSTGPINKTPMPMKIYPAGHPLNDIKELEQKLFSRIKPDEPIPTINKRRKLLRRLHRKEQKLLSNYTLDSHPIKANAEEARPDSLWDVKEMQQKTKDTVKICSEKKHKFMGPKKPTMYTVKDNKIVRLEPLAKSAHNGDDYQAVDIVIPVNVAEERILEGTKICVDDIKKIERFKDYEPGIPSKVLYVKNIASTVTQDQLQLLFHQFYQDNGGPLDVRLMTGRMRGQAFVAFENEEVSIRALEEVNGTIVGGRPIIVLFGRQSNRIQDEDNR